MRVCAAIDVSMARQARQAIEEVEKLHGSVLHASFSLEQRADDDDLDHAEGNERNHLHRAPTQHSRVRRLHCVVMDALARLRVLQTSAQGTTREHEQQRREFPRFTSARTLTQC